MPLRLDNAKSVAHMPTAEQQQTKKDFKPRFKVDPAASPMPETKLPERPAPGRHQNRNGGRDHLGMLGEIKSVYPGEIIGIRIQSRLTSILPSGVTKASLGQGLRLRHMTEAI
jgi:hypothetical protein